MNKVQKIWFVSIMMISMATVVLFQNCGEVVFVTDDNGNQILSNPNPPPICDPFSAGTTCPPPGGGGPTPPGLKGNIYYQNKGAGDAGWKLVDKYITDGVKTGYEILLTQIFVPTRKFDVGFAIGDGTYISKKAEHGGGKLVEWFAFDAEGILKLAPGDSDGKYEFAVISDDGSIVQIKGNPLDPWTTLINNDGETPTRMACGGPVDMTQNSRFPIRLKYFQGPANEIAINFIYRKKPVTTMTSGGGSTKDASCGATDANFYGVIEQNGSLGRTHAQLCSQFPNSKYGKLCQRGWKPLSSGNFE